MDTKSLFEINIAYGHSKKIQNTKPSGNNIYLLKDISYVFASNGHSR